MTVIEGSGATFLESLKNLPIFVRISLSDLGIAPKEFTPNKLVYKKWIPLCGSRYPYIIFLSIRE